MATNNPVYLTRPRFVRPMGAHQYAVLIAMIAAVALPIGDVMVKQMAVLLPIVLIAWVRHAVMAVALGALIIHQRGPRALWPNAAPLQTARAVLALLAILAHYQGIKYLPLVEVTAITFLSPLIAVGLSWVFLNERPSRSTVLALSLGLLGVVAITRPGGALFTPAVIFPLVTAICLGIYLTLTRKVASFDHPVTTTFFSALVACVLLTGVLPWLPAIELTQTEAITLIAIGIVAALGQLLTATAYQLGTTPIVAPVAYLSLLVATLLSWLVFNTVPDVFSWIGMGLIVAGGLLTLQRNR